MEKVEEKEWLVFVGGVVGLIVAILTGVVIEKIIEIFIPVKVEGGIITLGVLLIWVIKSIKVVPPTEMGVLVIFGISVKFVDSGPKFVPWLPWCFIAMFPKKLYKLDFPKKVAVTKEGIYNGREYGAQEVTVDCTLYFRFPRNKNLITAFEAHIPTDEKNLTEYWTDIVVGSLRAVLGNRTWKEITEKQKCLADETTVLLAQSSQFQKSGARTEDIVFVIEEVHLPSSLTRAFVKVDEQRLEQEASAFEAQEIAVTTMGAIIAMISEQTGLKKEEIQKELKENPQRFLKKYEDLIEKNWDIIVRKIGIKGGCYLDIRTIASEPGKTLIDLIAAFLRMPGKDQSKKKQRESEYYTLEEIWELERRIREEEGGN